MWILFRELARQIVFVVVFQNSDPVLFSQKKTKTLEKENILLSMFFSYKSKKSIWKSLTLANYVRFVAINRLRARL